MSIRADAVQASEQRLQEIANQTAQELLSRRNIVATTAARLGQEVKSNDFLVAAEAEKKGLETTAQKLRELQAGLTQSWGKGREQLRDKTGRIEQLQASLRHLQGVIENAPSPLQDLKSYIGGTVRESN